MSEIEWSRVALSQGMEDNFFDEQKKAWDKSLEDLIFLLWNMASWQVPHDSMTCFFFKFWGATAQTGWFLVFKAMLHVCLAEKPSALARGLRVELFQVMDMGFSISDTQGTTC